MGQDGSGIASTMYEVSIILLKHIRLLSHCLLKLVCDDGLQLFFAELVGFDTGY